MTSSVRKENKYEVDEVELNFQQALLCLVHYFLGVSVLLIKVSWIKGFF